MEMVPDLTAATSSGAACFWIFSIITTWLLLSRAALAMASRLFSGSGAGRAAAASGTSAAGVASAVSVAVAARALRSAMISRLRRASTPRWKSDTLRRPRCWSIIHRCTSSID